MNLGGLPRQGSCHGLWHHLCLITPACIPTDKAELRVTGGRKASDPDEMDSRAAWKEKDDIP